MKSFFLIIIALFFIGCATAPVGPKPNVTPITVSNKATRASIKKVRTSIKTAQMKQAEGDTALEKAHSYLNQLLNEK